MEAKIGAFTDLNTVLNGLRMTEALVKDLLNGDEELREQILLVYAGLSSSIDAFVEASYVAKTKEEKQIVLAKLEEQIKATTDLMNGEGKLIKFPTINKPQA